MRIRLFNLCSSIICLVVLATSTIASPIDPNNPPDGRFADDWGVIYLAGQKVGYMHSTMTRAGDNILTDSTTVMRLGRVDQPIKIKLVEKATETLAGQAISFESIQDLSTHQSTVKGVIHNGKVNITNSQFGVDLKNEYDFPEGASLKSWAMFREGLLRGFKPGTTYENKLYEPAMRVDGIIKAKTLIGDIETIEIHNVKTEGQRVTVEMITPLGSMTMLSWVNPDGQVLKASVPAPGMGNMDIVMCSAAVALADFIPPEIFMTSSIKAGQRIDADAAEQITYRVKRKNKDIDLGDFPSTGMQRVISTTPDAIVLTVTRQAHTPQSAAHTKLEKAQLAEFLDSNLMINSRDPQIIKLATKAAAGESNPFVLGDKLRKFVTDYIEEKNLSVGFATASEVCRTKEGDCSEHAVLLAALGRVHNIPSRVAVGLAYVPLFGRQNDIFGYHMWTQFYLDGRWIDFDAALRETECSPTRITFATSSLKTAGGADISLPLIAKIGGIDLDIVKINPRKK